MPTESITCGTCGQAVAAVVLEMRNTGMEPRRGVRWLLCPVCADGCVRTSSGAVYPVAPAGADVVGLPDDVRTAWAEARITHSVAAFTASEMMCRKILMNVAVNVVEKSKPGKHFTDYIDDLVEDGHVTKNLRAVVDQVRARGNIANHRLPASTEEDSLRTLAITEHLLRGTYELPGYAP